MKKYKVTCTFDIEADNFEEAKNILLQEGALPSQQILNVQIEDKSEISQEFRNKIVNSQKQNDMNVDVDSIIFNKE